MPANSNWVLMGAEVFDGLSEQLSRVNVFVRDGRIAEVSDRPPLQGDGEVEDVTGKTVIPGLIDAHIHAYANSVNAYRIDETPPTYHGAWAGWMLKRMLHRGFTTVRDTGGADYGLWMALRDGLIEGPRLYYCGRAISQTGGHADPRNPHAHCQHDEDLLVCGCGRVTHMFAVVDGVDHVRQVVRENLRRGASFIKFMGSGGVSSTGDSLTSIQYSDEEVRAIVDEVNRHGLYCTTHIHPDAALKRAIELGVHCIEHGTLIEPDTARMAAESGTYIVPTMAIIGGLAARGEELGYPPQSLEKLELIKDEAVGRLQHMKDAGCFLGFGSDLLGELENEQCREWTMRSSIFSNYEMLVQATSNNAKIIGAEGELGVIAPGAHADMVVVDGNPLEDISLMLDDGAHFSAIVKGGKKVRRN